MTPPYQASRKSTIYTQILGYSISLVTLDISIFYLNKDLILFIGWELYYYLGFLGPCPIHYLQHMTCHWCGIHDLVCNFQSKNFRVVLQGSSSTLVLTVVTIKVLILPHIFKEVLKILPSCIILLVYMDTLQHWDSHFRASLPFRYLGSRIGSNLLMYWWQLCFQFGTFFHSS